MEVPPLQIDPLAMAGLLFEQGPAAWRKPEALRAMPGETLAVAANAWGETSSRSTPPLSSGSAAKRR